MKYQRFDPAECGFPPPRVPLLAGPNLHSLQLWADDPENSPTLPSRVRYFSRGRYALLEAYRQSGIGPHSTLLIPAYHCRTMLDPAIRLGAQVALFAVNQDLSPNFDSLNACLRSAQKPTRALLVPHYFGVAQDLMPMVNFCTQNGLVLIEDCSHAFVHPKANLPAPKGQMGATGRFCVSSPYKFFPTPDGGMLWTNEAQEFQDLRQTKVGLQREIKLLVRSLQKNFAKARLPNINDLASEIEAISSAPPANGVDIEEQTDLMSPQYVIAEETLQSLVSSRWLVRHTNRVDLAARRRENYLAWLDGTAALPFCSALVPELPADCVPYMFPLKLDHPEVHFFALKRLGVPIWRWDDMAVSGCRVAADLRLKLLHLPCHQALSPKQMAWMIAAVTRVLSDVPVENKP